MKANTLVSSIKENTKNDTKKKRIDESKNELLDMMNIQNNMETNIIESKRAFLTELKDNLQFHRLQMKTFINLSMKYEPDLGTNKLLIAEYKKYIKYNNEYEKKLLELIPKKSQYTNCKESIKVKLYGTILSSMIAMATTGVVYGSIGLVNTLYDTIYYISWANQIPSLTKEVKKLVQKKVEINDITVINELNSRDDCSMKKSMKKAITTLYETFIIFFDYLYTLTEWGTYMKIKKLIEKILNNEYISYSSKLYFIVLMIDSKVDLFIKKGISIILCYSKSIREDSKYEQKIKTLKNMKEPNYNTEFLTNITKKIKKYNIKVLKEDNGCPLLKNIYKCKKYPCINKCSTKLYGVLSSKKYCNIKHKGDIKEVECKCC